MGVGWFAVEEEGERGVSGCVVAYLEAAVCITSSVSSSHSNRVLVLLLTLKIGPELRVLALLSLFFQHHQQLAPSR